jgi:DNA-binding NarL/FixJ family response regulator
MECRHLNGQRDDNRLENLAWGTRKENCADARAHGTARPPKGGYFKLTDATVTEIKRLLLEGMTQRDVAARFGISQSTVSHVKLGKTWKHVA